MRPVTTRRQRLSGLNQHQWQFKRYEVRLEQSLKHADQFIIPQYGSGRLCRGNDGDSHEISPIPLSAMLTKLFICKVDLDFSFSKFTLILSTDFLG